MDKQQLEAIRARDAMFAHVPVERLVTQSMVDRRALLSAYDALRARLAEAEALLRELYECGAIANWMRVSDDLRARIDAFLAADSATHRENDSHD